MRIDVYSDMVCPFCYLGSRHLELALEEFTGAEAGGPPDVEVVWRSYQLDPHAPAVSEQTTTSMLATKYGISEAEAIANQQQLTEAAASVGLDYHLAGTTVANTHDAHRITTLAREVGGDELAATWVRRVMRAYFTENRQIGDPDVLAALAGEIGLETGRVRTVLAGTEFADQVQTDAERARALGVQGVPFFVIDNRFGVSGAQPPEVLLAALRRATGEDDQR